MKFIIPIIFIISFSFEAHKSRQSILLTYDGQVMPVGTLAALEILNYDILVQNYIGPDNNAGKYSTQSITIIIIQNLLYKR